MKIALAFLAVVLCVTSVGLSSIFVATRVAGFGHDGDMQYTSYGNASQIRLKGGADYGGMVVDFDRAAIAAFVAANPGATARLFVKECPDAVGDSWVGDADVRVYTLNMRNNWAGGQGNGGYGNDFNWPGDGTAAATTQFAKTYWDGVTKTALATSEWYVNTGGSGVTLRSSSLRGMTNSMVMDGGPAFMGQYIYADLDPAVLADLISDDATGTNRGLVLGTIGGGAWQLNLTYGLGAGQENAPYIEIVPEPATMGLIALGAMAVIRRRR